jgi:nitrogen fixation protein FixH
MAPSSALPSHKSRSGIGRFLPHWIPMLFIAGFLVVIGVNGVLIFFAEDTFSGLETESAYERGLSYNKALAAQAAQDQLGWQYQAAISDETGGQRTLRVRMTDRDGRPLPDLTLEAHLIRPSNDGMDMMVRPLAAGDGSYVAAFTLPAPGQWDLRLVARRGEVAWQNSERLFVK